MNKLIINLITVSRIILGILFFIVVLCYNQNISYILVIFILTFFSDYFDGKLSRKFNLDSFNGSVLDVLCDFIFIILATLSLVLTDLIPVWFLIIIILKLIEFFKTSGRKNLKYEKFGHIVALMFYAFPFIVILINSKNISLILSIFITVCAILSSFLRIKNMVEFND